jgi:hypothetical protein
MKFKNPEVIAAIRQAILTLAPTRRQISYFQSRKLHTHYVSISHSAAPTGSKSIGAAVKALGVGMKRKNLKRIVNRDGLAWGWIDKESGRVLVGRLMQDLETPADYDTERGVNGYLFTDLSEEETAPIFMAANTSE